MDSIKIEPEEVSTLDWRIVVLALNSIRTVFNLNVQINSNLDH